MGSGDILEEITMIDAFETSGTSPSTDEHESAPLGLIPTQFNRPLLRKPHAKRLFSGMVGLPPESEDTPKSAQKAVAVLEPEPMPVLIEPAPKKRGRPPKGDKAATSAERKRASRTNAEIERMIKEQAVDDHTEGAYGPG